MGCGASSANLANVPDRLDPLYVLPPELMDGKEEDLKFSFGPKYTKMTTEITTIPIIIGDTLKLFLDCSSKGLVLRTGKERSFQGDNNSSVIAVCRKVGSNLNIYKLTPVYNGQQHDKYAKHVDNVSKLYLYGSVSYSYVFTYVVQKQIPGGMVGYHYTTRKEDPTNHKMYSCLIKQTTQPKPTNVVKWVYQPNDDTNYVKIFNTTSTSSSTHGNRQPIDIGLMVSLFVFLLLLGRCMYILYFVACL